jgi:hypothetical protein
MTENIEEKVKHILTDKRLSEFKNFLESSFSIECILLLYMDKNRWKDAKEFMRSLNMPISDGTWRARMIQIDYLLDRMLLPNITSEWTVRRYSDKQPYPDKQRNKEFIGKLAKHLLEFIQKVDQEIRQC